MGWVIGFFVMMGIIIVVVQFGRESEYDDDAYWS